MPRAASAMRCASCRMSSTASLADAMCTTPTPTSTITWSMVTVPICGRSCPPRTTRIRPDSPRRSPSAYRAWPVAPGVLITDDGTGDADPAAGTGLRGIERRLAAFDGTMAVSSPPGGPTVITMELPCALSSPRTMPSSVTD